MQNAGPARRVGPARRNRGGAGGRLAFSAYCSRRRWLRASAALRAFPESVAVGGRVETGQAPGLVRLDLSEPLRVIDTPDRPEGCFPTLGSSPARAVDSALRGTNLARCLFGGVLARADRPLDPEIL